VQEVSDLDEYDISYLHSDTGSDVVVGLTRQNQIVVWRYHPMVPHRTIMGERTLDPSSGWFEHLIVVSLTVGTGREHIFTASNDGKVTHWRLDQEQHTDSYVIDVCHPPIPSPPTKMPINRDLNIYTLVGAANLYNLEMPQK
jgi:hypothetical protein